MASSNHHLKMGLEGYYLLNSKFAFDSKHLKQSIKWFFGAFIPLRVGYRYQNLKGGFFFRVGYTPFFLKFLARREKFVFLSFLAGVSFGKVFMLDFN